jgi:hypothetical protein
MCGIEPYSSALLWMFVAGSVCMAVLARKLNEHLLVPPPPPKHLLFRKKNHIRPSYLMKPDVYFDAAGQPWAWRFTLVTAVTVTAGGLALYGMVACR